jgi:hypothetical protein
MLKPGDRVVRVGYSPLRQGNVGDKGTVERVFSNEQYGDYGFNVLWDRDVTEAQYVAANRIVDLATYEAAGSTSSASPASGS